MEQPALAVARAVARAGPGVARARDGTAAEGAERRRAAVTAAGAGRADPCGRLAAREWLRLGERIAARGVVLA